MEYAILGPLRLEPPATLPPKEAQLLAALLVRADSPVSTDTLTDVLWGDRPPATAAASLQVRISQLRKRIGADRLVTLGQSYRLVLGDDLLDTRRFRDAVSSAAQALVENRHASASLLLQGALALWRGTPLPELSNWVEATGFRQELEELRALALELKAEADLALGLHAQVAVSLGTAALEFPFREGLRRLLATALYRCGRQVDALDELRSLREAMNDEFGVDVSHETAALETSLLRQDGALDVPVAPAETDDLPPVTTPTFGREKDLARLLSDLDSGQRLITITGPGGTGKTRLALEVAHRSVGRFGGPVDVVELSTVRDPDLVLVRVADQLAPEREAGGDAVDVIRRRYAAGGLLVLDNLEQVLGAARDVAGLLERAPELRVVTTSRAPLQLRAEHTFPLEPLEMEAGPHEQDSPARAMFRDRLDARRGGREWSADEERAADDVVSLVDGLPLAIELAAARGRLLGPRALAARLRESMSLLEEGPADLPRRQQSMHRTIEWSVRLLSAEHRAAFGRLAAFESRFDVAAATSVLAVDELSALAILEALTDASLIRLAHDERGEPVFSMLRVIRSFALGDLSPSERGAVRDGHAAWVVDFATLAEPHLDSPDEGSWSWLVNRYRGDVVAASLHLCDSGRAAAAAKLNSSLFRYWISTSAAGEGAVLMERVLEEGLSPLESARVLRLSSRLLERLGRYDAALAEARRGVDIASALDERTLEAQLHATLATSSLWLEKPEDAAAHWERILELADPTSDVRLRAVTLGNLGLLALERGEFTRALDIYERALSQLRDLGAAGLVNDTLTNLAWASLGLGRLEDASHTLSGLAARLHEGDVEQTAYYLLGVARLCSLGGDHGTALRLTAAAISALAGEEQVFEPYELSIVDSITVAAESAGVRTAGAVVPTMAESIAVAETVLRRSQPAAVPQPR